MSDRLIIINLNMNSDEHLEFSDTDDRLSYEALLDKEPTLKKRLPINLA